jgi:hypothetical protein
MTGNSVFLALGRRQLVAPHVANIAFADRLVHAEDIQEVVALQTEFVQAR